MPLGEFQENLRLGQSLPIARTPQVWVVIELGAVCCTCLRQLVAPNVAPGRSPILLLLEPKLPCRVLRFELDRHLGIRPVSNWSYWRLTCVRVDR